ncbi:hypothetical protein JHN59_10605 [Streptomyces sp. MBT49]|uniref:hypothetical protein n=1 Tax=Streptomyces sp. MBT49 TaxID=1488380 RepID=UPI00190D8F64|nr:hypothetical protein [Streptomyces sp. MBT49]MBK3625289.1 hypothetical protein [Streptomyces sp. MBT49]
MGRFVDARLLAAREEAEEDFLLVPAAQGLDLASGEKCVGFQNIVGVGLRDKRRDGQRTGETSVAIYVVRKEPLDLVDQAAVVPAKIAGVPTDVVQSGEFVAFAQRGRYRPAPSGVSLGHSSGTTGTLGFFARRDGDLFVVGCNHVLACENQSTVSDVIVQPAPEDGGSAAGDAVAELSSWVKLRFGRSRNRVDAAMAVVTEPVRTVSPAIFDVGPIGRGLCQPQDDLKVLKYGRTTGLSRGVVTDYPVTARVRHGLRRAFMADQMIVESVDGRPFSDHGDSGSLVVEEGTFNPVGVVCGGTEDYTVVSQISHVLDELGVSFAHE